MNILTEQDQNYKNYVDNHIKNVQSIWYELDKLCTDIFWLDDCMRVTMDCLIKSHDQSKYSDDEFYGYRQWFYPEDDVPKSKYYFDLAWNHHQKHNPHHWEYWIMQDQTILPMSGVYWLEMLCDWGGMSLKFGDLPSQFYDDNFTKMRIHPDTRQAIDNWIELVDTAVINARNNQ